MRKNAAVTDEEIIAALMAHSSIQSAAHALDLSPRTIYDRMGTREFKAAYSATKGDILRQAVANLNASIAEAIQTARDIMTDQKAAPAVRLQAVKLIMDNAGRFADRLAKSDTATAEYAANPLDLSKW